MITDKQIKSLGWQYMACCTGNTVYNIGTFILEFNATGVYIFDQGKTDEAPIYKNDNIDLFMLKVVMLYLKIPINGSNYDPLIPTSPATEKPNHVFDRFRGSYIKDLGSMVLECKISLCSLKEPKLSLEISSYRVGEKGIVIDNHGCPKETYCDISFFRGVDQVLEDYFGRFRRTYLL